jgi:hypothetical protein
MRFGTLPFGRNEIRQAAATPGKALSVQADFLILMEEIGSGSETSIRVPHLGQYMKPACSSTLGTVVNMREQLGHLTLIILTNEHS